MKLDWGVTCQARMILSGCVPLHGCGVGGKVPVGMQLIASQLDEQLGTRCDGCAIEECSDAHDWQEPAEIGFPSIKTTSNTSLANTHHQGDALERLTPGGIGSAVGAGGGRTVASDCPLTSLVREKAPLDRLSEDLGYEAMCSSDRRKASFSGALWGIARR